MNSATISSSNDVMKANSAPDQHAPGRSRQRHWKNVPIGVAPG